MRGGNAQPGSQPSVIPVPTSPLQDQMVYDIVDAVPRAWEEIQNLHPSWKWMRGQLSLPLTQGQRTFTQAQIQAVQSDYRSMIPFDAGSPVYANIFDAGASQQVYLPLFYVEYEDFRGYWDRQPYLPAGQPFRFTQRPDFTLEFAPAPGVPPSGGANKWTLVCDYHKLNVPLVNSGDVPGCPDVYHELIAWKAVEIICAERNSTGYLAQLARDFIYGVKGEPAMGKLAQLEQDQLPLMLIDLRFG